MGMIENNVFALSMSGDEVAEEGSRVSPPPGKFSSQHTSPFQVFVPSVSQFNIAFAWWTSLLLTEYRDLNPQAQTSAEQSCWLRSPRKLSCQDLTIYQKIRNILKIHQKVSFKNKEKNFNPLTPETTIFSNTILWDFPQALQSYAQTQSIDETVRDVCLYIIRDLGIRSTHHITAITRAWGLHQLYLYNSQAVCGFFHEHGIHFCNPWNVVLTPVMRARFWDMLEKIEPSYDRDQITPCCKNVCDSIVVGNEDVSPALAIATRTSMLEFAEKIHRNSVKTKRVVQSDQKRTKTNNVSNKAVQKVPSLIKEAVLRPENSMKKRSFSDLTQDNIWNYDNYEYDLEDLQNILTDKSPPAEEKDPFLESILDIFDFSDDPFNLEAQQIDINLNWPEGDWSL